MGWKPSPIELELPSPRVLAENDMIEEDWVRNRYEELAFLDEKRLRALCHVGDLVHERRIARAFNKKVKLRDLKVGDLVLKEVRLHVSDPMGNF